MDSFEKILVIGCGKIVGDVLKYLIERKSEYSYEIEYIEHELSNFSSAKAICNRFGIPYYLYLEKEQVSIYLEREIKRTLIISAGNHYIFPKYIIERDNIVIINFHNALLPKYPGRNATTWAIYYGEAESGATWHYVNKLIDAGKIICQKKCLITEDMKAYELAGRIMELAFEGLRENFDSIMKNKMQENIAEKYCPQRKIYYSYEIPDHGRFDISDNVDNIYRLLRATDYGKNNFFPNMRTKIPDVGEIEIISYRKVQLAMPSNISVQFETAKHMLWLSMKDGNVLRLKYRKVENGEKVKK